MTTTEIIAHWRKGATDALEAASLLAKDGKYELALFDCHLAVEKALKAAIMETTGKPHPKIHDLSVLAVLVKEEWTTEEKQLFDALSDFAIAARYDDPAWAQREATAANTEHWLRRVIAFLPSLLP